MGRFYQLIEGGYLGGGVVSESIRDTESVMTGKLPESTKQA